MTKYKVFAINADYIDDNGNMLADELADKEYTLKQAQDEHDDIILTFGVMGAKILLDPKPNGFNERTTILGHRNRGIIIGTRKVKGGGTK